MHPALDNTDFLADETYDYVYSHTPRLCVDVVIVQPQRGILLTRRAIPPQLGKWHIPGGRVRHQESLHDAAYRLIKKETDLTLTNLDEIGTMEFLHERDLPTGRKVHSVSVAFQSNITEPVTPTGCSEGEELAWCTELPDAETMDPTHHAFLARQWNSLFTT